MAEYKSQLHLLIVVLLVTSGALKYVMAETGTNLALYKPVNQTDTSREALATLAVDGNASTCSQTTTVVAEWIVDLMDYYILQEVTILPEFSSISQWGSGLEAYSSEQPDNRKWAQFIMHKNGGSPWMPKVNNTQPYIEVTYQQVVQVSGVDIHELYRSGSVKAITCKADRWITLWSTAPNNSLSYGRIFSPELHSTCISNFIRLEFEVLDYEVAIDALQLHGIPQEQTFRIQGRTKGLYKNEGIVTVSKNETARWSLMDQSVVRQVTIQKHPQLDPLKVCEVTVTGYKESRIPPFRVVTGIGMLSQRITTVTMVTSKIICAQECLRQVAPACRIAQLDQDKQSCALFESLGREKDTMNGNFTIIFKNAFYMFE